MCTNPIKITQNGEEYTVKCGKCPTCRRERTQEWAIKLINEAKYHKKASFITLTFDNKILLNGNKYGADASFIYHIENSKEYFKKFIKRLRKRYKEKKLTYYHVGEYWNGEKTHRPHHHMILFGENFEEDRKECQLSKTGHQQFYSQTLYELWGCGNCTIQDINSNNIIYISQYSLKKNKQNEDKRYRAIQSFSNRSKMNIKWIRRNYNEIKKGFIQDKDGKKYRIPKSYLNNLKNEKNEEMKEAYRQYEENIMEHIGNTSTNDLINKQKIKEKIREYNQKSLGKSRDF